MRRIVGWLAATATVVALLIAYRTSTPGVRRGTGPTASVRPRTVGVDGPRVDTAWGPIQVRLVTAGDRIVDVVMLVSPAGDAAVNADALPRLRAEVLAAQGADVDAVTGATVTTDGYLRSVRGALDRWRGSVTSPAVPPEPGESDDD